MITWLIFTTTNTQPTNNKMSSIIEKFSAMIEKFEDIEELANFWNAEGKEEILLLLKDKVKDKAKKKKDVNAPKKNVSAWILFCKVERPKVKKEFPNMPPKEVMTELAKRWKIAKEDEDVLKEFAQGAKKDKERYEEEKKDYVSPVESDNDSETPKKKKAEKKAKKTKKVKAVGEPTRPKSAWLFFCEDERKKLAKEEDAPKGKEILIELGRRWKGVSDKKKIKFNKLAAQAKEQYAEDMEKFKAGKEEEEEEESEDEVEVEDE